MWSFSEEADLFVCLLHNYPIVICLISIIL